MSVEDEIDRLYQLPLAEFTPARNALASRAAPRAGAVKALQKPTLPAWVLNQIYWTRRPVFDALVQAAERRRRAHARVIGGQAADLAKADADHRNALREAVAVARQILTASGAPATGATLNALTDGLDSLPTAGPAGRWVRPPAPLGLEALAGLSAAARQAPAAAVSAAGSRAAAARQADREAKREAEARRRDAKAVEKETKAARAAERAAETAFTRARLTLADVEKERGRLESQLKFATKRAQDLADEIRHAEQALTKASAARAQLERRLERLLE